jgi:hypothetical protein
VAVDQLVDGSVPPRFLSPDDPGQCTFEAPPASAAAVDASPRRRPHGIHAQTEWLTWWHAVWVFRDRCGRQCRAVVPAAREAAFLAELDAGRLDRQVHRMIRRQTPRRSLLVNAQIGEGGLWHDVRPGALVPAERLPDGRVPRVSIRAARRSHRSARRGESA